MKMSARAYSILSINLLLAGCESPSTTQRPAAEPPMASATDGSPATAAPATTIAAPVTPTAPMADAPEKTPPAMVLGETAADKLGSVPAALGLKVGSKAPNAKLPSVTGKVESLSTLYREGPTFVVFYRGGWCPFCNLQLHALTTAKPDFDKKGLRIVAISVDKPDKGAETQAKHGVPFPMLSDSDLVAHKAFNVVHVPPEAEAKALAGYGIDLAQYSGKAHNNFAVPAIFLVDRSGVIKWVHVDEDYKTRPSPKQMLEVADRTLAR